MVALVGYTNAGKSTLFNALTRAETVSSAQLFSTLDPLLRRLTLPSRLEIVLSDTVGFVRKLPHDLVAAFRATLEEVRQADVLLHVVDISSPHWREQAAAVEDVLSQLEVQSTPRIEVYNKVDLLAPDTSATMSRISRSVAVSARDGMGLDALMVRIDEELESFSIAAEFRVPYDQAGILSRLHEQGRGHLRNLRG